MIIYKYTRFIQKDFSKGTFHKSMVAQKFVKMDYNFTFWNIQFQKFGNATKAIPARSIKI